MRIQLFSIISLSALCLTFISSDADAQVRTDKRARNTAPFSVRDAIPKRAQIRTPREAMVAEQWMGWFGEYMGGLKPGHLRALDWPCSVTTHSSKDTDLKASLPKGKTPTMTASYDRNGRLTGFRNYMTDAKGVRTVDKEFTLLYSKRGHLIRFIQELPRGNDVLTPTSLYNIYNARGKLIRTEVINLADSRDTRTGLVALKLRVRSEGDHVVWDEKTGMRLEGDWDLELASVEVKKQRYSGSQFWLTGKGPSGTFTHTLDQEGRLKSVDADQYKATFTYDAFGRVQKRTEENNLAGKGTRRTTFMFTYDAARPGRLVRIDRTYNDVHLAHILDYTCHK